MEITSRLKPGDEVIADGFRRARVDDKVMLRWQTA
jgi:multidrug efflux pump subunit AcrA (membrane-fusion protein)